MTSKIISAVAQDLRDIKIDPKTDTIQSIHEKFWEVMKKHKICQGTKTEGGGRTMCNPEWVMCIALLAQNLDMQLRKFDIICDMPEELLSY